VVDRASRRNVPVRVLSPRHLAGRRGNPRRADRRHVHARMTRVLAVRHAQSVWNAEGRWQGHADPPLSDRGRADARAAARVIEGMVERVAASDLLRALETAEIVGDALLLGDVDIVPDLREIDIGAWSGLTREEIEERWPGGIEGWRSGDFAPPGAENREAFVERVVRG